MATNFPSSLDSFTNPTAVDTLDSPPHDTQHADANDAIEALQAKVGVDGSAVTTSIDYQLNTGYRYHSTVYFTSSGTFTKASYPWLRAVRVKVQGAGGGGGSGARTSGSFGNNHGAAGGAGGYAERFITDIAGLAASETVTVGSGGAAGANPNTSDVHNVGSNGGNSSAFGLTGTGGQGGNNAVIANCCDFVAHGGEPSGTYDFGVNGECGNYRRQNLTREQLNGAKDYVVGGVSYLSGPSRGLNNNGGAINGSGYGYGGNPGKRTSSGTGVPGLNGGDGVVIVELYA